MEFVKVYLTANLEIIVHDTLALLNSCNGLENGFEMKVYCIYVCVWMLDKLNLALNPWPKWKCHQWLESCIID